MRHRERTIVIVALALLTGAAALWLLSGHSQTDGVGVSFVGFTSDGSGRRMAQFKYMNRSHVTIVSADDCLTQIKGVNPGTLTPLHDIRLQPGESEMILLAPPESKGAWRIRIGHWPEDWRNNLKTWVVHGCKRLKIPRRLIPFSLRTIRTQYIWSDWVTDSLGYGPEQSSNSTLNLAGSGRTGAARK